MGIEDSPSIIQIHLSGATVVGYEGDIALQASRLLHREAEVVLRGKDYEIVVKSRSQMIVVPGAIPHRHVFRVITQILRIHILGPGTETGVHALGDRGDSVVEECLEQSGMQ